jgi:hypothetical protein
MPVTLPRGRRFVPAASGGGGPTVIRAYDDLTMPTSAATDNDAYVMGVTFYVTAAAELHEIRFWQPSDNSPSTATRSGALWRIVDTTQVTSTETFPATVDGWNTLTLSTPFTLVANVRYRACVLHPAGRYSAISNFYTSGAGATDLVEGVLTVPSAANSTGGGQNTFIASSTMAYPSTTFNSAYYGLDVGVVAL